MRPVGWVRDWGSAFGLKRDESGTFLWAEYALGIKAPLPSGEITLAGAGFGTYFHAWTLRIRLSQMSSE
jgi:hypothetical protein